MRKDLNREVVGLPPRAEIMGLADDSSSASTAAKAASGESEPTADVYAESK